MSFVYNFESLNPYLQALDEPSKYIFWFNYDVYLPDICNEKTYDKFRVEALNGEFIQKENYSELL